MLKYQIICSNQIDRSLRFGIPCSFESVYQIKSDNDYIKLGPVLKKYLCTHIFIGKIMYKSAFSITTSKDDKLIKDLWSKNCANISSTIAPKFISQTNMSTSNYSLKPKVYPLIGKFLLDFR
ncbi:hypothetical protein BpHYR1_043865 [Brachionus plicatilis]|uniref:Uncharacterized protein n=1 Tax=Brachionus plicatilis TaxID=10195 RepID=A0A3M7S9K0_BRAPC|nr:hypothetical protein BpHYR1_043865 [Brachionus plicatilis]